MADLIQIRRDTYDNWYTNNPTLALGEIGIITHVSGSGNTVPLEPKQCKIGDGTTDWRSLPTEAWAEPGLSGSIDARINEVSSSLHTEVAASEANTGYVTCGTAAATAAKEISDNVTLAGFVLDQNIRLLVKMTNANTAASPTLNINGTSAKAIIYNGATASDTNTWAAGEVLDVYYNGTAYVTNTHGGAQFSTGEKVGDVGIDDGPTAGSNNLVKSGGVYSNIFQYPFLASNDIYFNDVSEIYIVSELISDVQRISFKYYDGNGIFKTFVTTGVLFTCNLEITESTRNEVAYELRVTSTNDPVNYPINNLIAYIVFKNIEHFKSNVSGSDTHYINIDRAKKRYLQPIIEDYLNSIEIDNKLSSFTPSNISQNSVVKETAQNLFQIKYGKNRCNPDKITSKTGAYIRRADGEYRSTGSSSSNGYTGFIPISEKGLYCNKGVASSSSGWAAYRLATAQEIADTSVTKFLVEGVHYVFNHSSSNTDGKLYVYQSGDVYVRFSLSNTTEVQVEEGTTSTTYEQYSYSMEYNKEMLPDEDITIGDFSETEKTVKFLSDNICNPENCNFTQGQYIKASTGEITGTSTATVGTTCFIPIDEGGIYFNHSATTGNYGGYAYYSDSIYTAYIDGFYKNHKPSNDCTLNYAAYIPGAKYVRFSMDLTATSENIMASTGFSPKSYVPYLGETEIFSDNILPDYVKTDVSIYTEGVKINLPSSIYITIGDNLELFFKSCVECINPEVFDITAVCSVGRSYPRYFQFAPTSSNLNNSYDLTIYVKDNNRNIIAQKSSIIIVIDTISSPQSMKHILTIGASATANGYITAELNRRLNTSTGTEGDYSNPLWLNLNNITFVGSVTTSQGIKQEAHSGWQWKDFATIGRYAYRFFFDYTPTMQLVEGAVYSGNGTLKFTITEINNTEGYCSCTYTGSGTQPSSGTLTKYSGDGDDTLQYTAFNIDSGNPFWNDTTESLDFITYANQYCCETGQSTGHIDLLIIHLGVNDIFASRSAASTKELYIKPFLDAFHSQFPNAKVIISSLPLPSPFGGMTVSYGASVSSNYWTKAKSFWEYAEMFNELLSETDSENVLYSSFVDLATVLHEFDCENLYPITTRNVNNRSLITETIQTNGVHPTDAGSCIVADSIFHIINRLLM